MEWAVFGVIVAALFAADLLASEALAFRGALLRTLVYVASAIAFGGYLWVNRGGGDALKFYTGYVLESSLSLDNVFVMSLIFSALSIPGAMRHRVLLWGVLGALVLRAAFIGAGVALVGRFDWVLLICGGFLIFAGVKAFIADGAAEVDLETSRAYRLLQRWVPITHRLHGPRFFANGAATPLFVALVLVEIADLIFAADSVPATLAVTHDPLLVYTSNIFAILGLRSLYVVLESLVSQFEHLGKAVALVLVFIGAKVVLAHPIKVGALDYGVFQIHDGLSLAVVLALLLGGILLSLASRRRHVGA